MIKRKFRNSNNLDYIQGKLITLPQPQTASNSSLLIKKDDKQSFARVIRMQSEKKLTNNDSFRSESRQKLIRDVYTPSQKDKLNQSIRKLNSSQSRSSVNNSAHKNLLYGNMKSQQTRKSSAKEQVRMIQNNLAPQDKEQDQQLKSLSKLVDYSLYKNQSSNANRQRIFDQNRSQLQGRSSMHTTTNQSILKVQNLQNSQLNKNTHQSQIMQKNLFGSQNKPLQIEINGNSSSLHSKNQSLAIQTSKALTTNSSNLPYLTSKSNSQASPSSHPKTFRYGTESVQIKENKIIRQKDQPRYNFPKKYENKLANSQLIPSNLQPKSKVNNNKMY